MKNNKTSTNWRAINNNGAIKHLSTRERKLYIPPPPLDPPPPNAPRAASPPIPPAPPPAPPSKLASAV